MLIPIRFSVSPGDDDDSSVRKRSRPSVAETLLLLELQGDVRPRKELSLDGLPLGNLTLLKNNKATLVIGNHLLEGKMVKLSKPFLAIRKVAAENPQTQSQGGGESSAGGGGNAAETGSNSNSNPNTSADAGEEKTATATAYDVVSLIRHKFIFTASPTPLNRQDPRVTCALGLRPEASAEPSSVPGK